VSKPARSVLAQRARQPSLLLPLGCSIFGHGFVVVAAMLFTLLGSLCSPKRPVIEIDQSMEVSIVQKSQTKMPDRAQRAPVPKGDVAPAPEPQPAPPPNPSDLVFEKEEAEPEEGYEADRQAMLDALMRQQLLDDLDAPEGKVDRNVTDPNSTADETINAAAAHAAGDPEVARYKAKISSLMRQHFNPLQAIVSANPEIRCVLMVHADMQSGAIHTVEVFESSGIPAYDEAAKQAAWAVGTFPLPPERFKALFETGYQLNMDPP